MSDCGWRQPRACVLWSHRLCSLFFSLGLQTLALLPARRNVESLRKQTMRRMDKQKEKDALLVVVEVPPSSASYHCCHLVVSSWSEEVFCEAVSLEQELRSANKCKDAERAGAVYLLITRGIKRKRQLETGQAQEESRVEKKKKKKKHGTNSHHESLPHVSPCMRMLQAVRACNPPLT